MYQQQPMQRPMTQPRTQANYQQQQAFRVPPNMSPHAPQYQGYRQTGAGNRQQMQQRPGYQQHPNMPRNYQQQRPGMVPSYQRGYQQPQQQFQARIPPRGNPQSNINQMHRQAAQRYQPPGPRGGQREPPRPITTTRTPQQRPQSVQNDFPFDLKNNTTTYILYYSNFCLNSKELLQMLVKTPFHAKFTKINISDGSAPVPTFLREVPTAIVPGHETPLVGATQISQWLEQQSAKHAKTMNQEITPYAPDEMSFGFGDSYSYLDVGDREQPMEHTFAFVGRPDQEIKTPAEEEFGDIKKSPSAEVTARTRPPMPQVPQMRPTGMMSNGGRQPMMIPQSDTGDRQDMEKAYSSLLERRAAEVPRPQQPLQ